jgi:hypothetical protein
VEGQIFAVLGLAFVLGLKHATDADHVAAITTFVGRERSPLGSCWVGIFWGAGHTAALAVAGILVLFLKVSISTTLESRLELAVAMMLVALGVRVLYKCWREQPLELHRHAHVHSPSSTPHVHWHVHSMATKGTHRGWLHVGLRPLLVGMVHGAAGSGALTILVLSTIRSSAEGLAYIAIFGIGSIAGMMLINLLLALPLQWIGTRVSHGYRRAQIAAGVFSCLFGIHLAWTML